MRLTSSRVPRIRKVASLLLAGILAAGAAVAQTGSANFNRYVALGDSLTAGFVSGGLVNDLQRVSYPVLIQRQATGSTTGFELPLVTPPGIPPVLQLRGLLPTRIAPAAGIGSPTNPFLPRPYNNLAVPGARVNDLIATRSGGLHDLILRGIGTQLEQAIFLQPTFVSLWIGNNDVLAAATSGIVIDDVTLTRTAAFEARLRTAVNALRASGAQLVIANIPNVTAIPFVNTVPAVLVNPQTNQPVIVNGAPVRLIGPDGLLVPGRDFVLLTATSELAQGRGIPANLGGSGLPLSNSAVLSAAEAAAIGARLAEINNVIRTVANEAGAAFFDANAFFDEVSRHGFHVGGIEFTPAFLTGGIFSVDGVHPTAFGYAVIANQFIAAINARFGGNIRPVNYRDYIFGPLARLSTGYPAVSTADLIFTRAAEDSLRSSLGLADRGTLEALAGGGGGGGTGGGGGPAHGPGPGPRPHGGK